MSESTTNSYEVLKKAVSAYGESAERNAKSIQLSAQDRVVARNPHLLNIPIPHNLNQTAFSHLLLSNDPPDDHESQSLKEVLKFTRGLLVHQDFPGTTDLNSSSQVAQLENDILVLNSALSAIRRVPQEILQCIFGVHLPKPDVVRPQNYIPADDMTWPWTLSQVCRTWRHVALSTPELWNHLPRLELTFDRSGDRQPQPPVEQLQFMIKHSKELPLHFFLDSETIQLSKNQRLMLELLSSQSERWSSAVICANVAVLAALRVNCVKGRLGQLRRLSLFLTGELPSTLDADIFSVAPQLQDIFLKGPHHHLKFPNTSQLLHYEALLDRLSPGIGHALYSTLTLQTLILQGTSLSPLEDMTTLPNLKKFSFRMDARNVHPGALDNLLLPALEELVICGDHEHILTTTLSLLRRSALLTAGLRPFPLKKIHIPSSGAIPSVIDDPATFLSIIGMLPSLQTLEMILPPIAVLQRLDKIDSDEIIAPALECLEFDLLLRLSFAEIAALNRIAAARCEINPHARPKAYKLLKAFTLYDRYVYTSEARLMRCHRRLEEWWQKGVSLERTITRTPSNSSIRSGSADSYNSPVNNVPLESPVDTLGRTIASIVDLGVLGLPSTTDACRDQHHISKQQVGEIISELKICGGGTVTITDISLSRIDQVLTALQSVLPKTSGKIINQHSHLTDLQEAIQETLNVWSAIIDKEFSSVHWVFGDATPGSESVLLCYIPQYHPIRLTEEKTMLVLDLDGKRSAFLEEHENICEEFRVSARLRTYPLY